VQELLRFGFIQQVTKAEVYQTARLHEPQIQQILEPLDLSMRIDEARGLLLVTTYETAATAEAQDESWSHPLVRRQRLTLEQSLLLALLRRHFLLAEEDQGIGVAKITLHQDEIVNEMLSFIPDSGSDANNERRVTNALSSLKDHGLVSAIDEHGEFSIRPIIVHLANPENLKALLQQYQSLATQD